MSSSKSTFLSVSTKTGDKGLTGLANGQRLAKDELVFEVLGTLDEFNSWLGVVVAQLPQSELPNAETYKIVLQEIQDILFQFGAVIAKSPKVTLDPKILTDLEKKSDKLQRVMAADWTTQFLYPGGLPIAAQVDVARTVCRRLERCLIRLANQEENSVPPLIQKYINRLSDYLFVLRCTFNQSANYEEKKFSYASKLVGSFGKK